MAYYHMRICVGRRGRDTAPTIVEKRAAARSPPGAAQEPCGALSEPAASSQAPAATAKAIGVGRGAVTHGEAMGARPPPNELDHARRGAPLQ
jgi:hypothetical protein